MGSAAAYHLARRGVEVVGFDRFQPPHAMGSSHGETRIIRVAYFEDPRYVPFVSRAWDLWLDLEMECERPLLRQTGGLMIGPPGGPVVAGALSSALAHGLPHERLDAATLMRRYPAHRVEPGDEAIWEPQAGYLDPEACVDAHVRAARIAGAELHGDEPVLDWRPDGEGVRVRTAKGECAAGRLIVAAGAWLPRLLPDLADRFSVARQPLFWFEPRSNAPLFDPGRFPIFIREHLPGRYVYGFPMIGGRVKFAIHMEGEPADPDTVRRTAGDDEVEKLRAILDRCLPDAAGRCVDRAVCLYTNTADEHFRLGPHPGHPQVIVASCCSGHGFKFASAAGEVLADLATGEEPKVDLGLFALAP